MTSREEHEKRVAYAKLKYGNGTPLQVIANDLRVGLSTVYRYVNSIAHFSEPDLRRRKKPLALPIKLLYEYYISGANTIDQLAMKAGVSPKTLKRRIKEYEDECYNRFLDKSD